MKYTLTVPFMELFFQLAYSSGTPRGAGWTGQITSNAFMKREWGTKLIADFLPKLDLRMVVDTSGAYIPGHGTPTVIIVGRNQSSSSDRVRAVLGIRGEPGRPSDPAKGFVWRSIAEHIEQAGYEDQYISVVDLPRTSLLHHPWSLSGGSSVALARHLKDIATRPLSHHIDSIGPGAVTGEDDVFVTTEAIPQSWRRNVLPIRLFVEGERVRDYLITRPNSAIYPYRDNAPIPGRSAIPALWPWRTLLQAGLAFGKVRAERGQEWWEYGMPSFPRLNAPLLIAFPFVATHNHFVLDRGGKVFKQTAPVITLGKGASEEDHIRLLGVLNSSVACFWLKQNCFNKGNGGIGGGIGDEDWEPRYEFTGTTVKDLPIPPNTPLSPAKELDQLAQELQAHAPHHIASIQTPTRDVMDSAQGEYQRLRALMIAQQEELDWLYYRIYGLLDEDLNCRGELPGITLGQRAFEIALARSVEDGEEETAWFARHSSTPVSEVPEDLPIHYRDLLHRRLAVIQDNPHIRLLERPEFKRRWVTESWDKQVESALRTWLLDRLDITDWWYDRDGRPKPQSVAQLADILDHDGEFCEGLRFWAGDSNTTTAAALAKLLADESVPFLAAYRYKASGLDKRADWEHTWALQRREDAGEKLDSPTPLPPKYKPADFVKTSYWSHRGKLDVSKERFISYPNAGRDSDASELLGWAGWDHAEQALALAALISARIDEGWDTPKLIPLLAGLHELQPWVRQWHNQIDPEYGESVADTIDDEMTARMAELHLTTTDLTSWRPPAPTRGRRARTP